MDDQLAYRPAQAAQKLGVSRRKVYELIDEGLIPSRKIGSARLIRHEDLVAFLDDLEPASARARKRGAA